MTLEMDIRALFKHLVLQSSFKKIQSSRVPRRYLTIPPVQGLCHSIVAAETCRRQRSHTSISAFHSLKSRKTSTIPSLAYVGHYVPNPALPPLFFLLSSVPIYFRSFRDPLLQNGTRRIIPFGKFCKIRRYARLCIWETRSWSDIRPTGEIDGTLMNHGVVGSSRGSWQYEMRGSDSRIYFPVKYKCTSV